MSKVSASVGIGAAKVAPDGPSLIAIIVIGVAGLLIGRWGIGRSRDD